MERDKMERERREKKRIGIVLSDEKRKATPLHFWILSGETIQLDDVVFTERVIEKKGEKEEKVRFYGVITEVENFIEGTQYCSDMEHIKWMEVETVYVGKVMTTRIEPEILIPPLPLADVFLAEREEFSAALNIDSMERKIPAGFTRQGEIAYIDLDYVDGKKGAHISISGVSGVATKTSYALSLLYFIMKYAEEKREKYSAIIFNVKGEDLLHLDKLNSKIKEEEKEKWKDLGAEPYKIPFGNLKFIVPSRKTAKREEETERDVLQREQGGLTLLRWSFKDFAKNEFFRFLFEEEKEAKYMGIVERCTDFLRDIAEGEEIRGISNPNLNLNIYGTERTEINSLYKFYELIERLVRNEASNKEVKRRIFADEALGTQLAFLRRLRRAVDEVGHLIGDKEYMEEGPEYAKPGEVYVVHIGNMSIFAQRFVVGAILRKIFRERETKGSDSKVFIFLDELGRYAPRDERTPLREIFRDIAERGRSLGVILISAQQGASFVDQRIIMNSSIKIVGRMSPEEVGKPEYGFLGGSKERTLILQPHSKFLTQPSLPIPIFVSFPFPFWATRKEEVKEEIGPPDLSSV